MGKNHDWGWFMLWSYNIIDNPKELMRNHIQNLMESRSLQLDFPSLFDSSDFKSLFGILDPSKCGHITSEQFRSGAYFLVVSN